MKTFNSPKPKPGKAEIFSFILLVLLSAAVFVVWHYGKNSGHNQKQPVVITHGESKINQNNEQNCDADAASVMIMPEVDKSVPRAEYDVIKIKPLAVIAPPLPAYETRLTENIVNANTGELITTNTNSQIHIPPDAFVDAQGKVVEGNVKVSYREYHDFRDIFLSGIPMEYEKGMLESAGMIEIRAAQNDEPVYVNPENKIRVMLASASKEKDYNLYYLDQKEMKWKEMGKDEIVLTKQTCMRQTEADNKRYGNDSQAAFYEYIETPQAKAFLDSIEKKFYFEQPKNPVELICRTDMRARKKHWFSRKQLSHVFDFSLSRTRTMPPELKVLTGVTWRYYGKDAQEVYMKLFGLEKMPKQTMHSEATTGYTYITEDLDAGAWNFQIHFTLERRTISIPVVPVFHLESSATNFTRKWKKYSAAYAKLRFDEQKRFEKFQADTAAYFVSNERYIVRNVSAENAALRTFTVDNFGFWNCDRPIPDMPSTVVAEFRDEKGNLLPIMTGYLVVKSRNTVYTVTDFRDFRFDPNAPTLFWAILPDNKLAVIYPEEFAKHQKAAKGDNCTFAIQVNATALNNISSLKSALSFN